MNVRQLLQDLNLVVKTLTSIVGLLVLASVFSNMSTILNYLDVKRVEILDATPTFSSKYISSEDQLGDRLKIFLEDENRGELGGIRRSIKLRFDNEKKSLEVDMDGLGVRVKTIADIIGVKYQEGSYTKTDREAEFSISYQHAYGVSNYSRNRYKLVWSETNDDRNVSIYRIR